MVESDDSEDEREVSKVLNRYSNVENEMQRVIEQSEDDEKGALVSGKNVNDIENDSSGKPKKYKDVAMDIIQRGVSNIDPSVKKTRNIIFVAALLSSFVNSMICFMAPCYIDLSAWLDCD